MVKTVAALPTDFAGAVNLTLNDWDPDVVGRNVVLLLIALIVEHKEEAIDCMIHFWYSASLRQSHMNILKQRIDPLIQRVREKTKNASVTSLHDETWTFGKQSLRLVFTQENWTRLGDFLQALPQTPNTFRPIEIRQAITLASSRQDFRDLHQLFDPPAHRIAKHRFREDGLLLPFGSHRSGFVWPNP